MATGGWISFMVGQPLGLPKKLRPDLKALDFSAGYRMDDES